MRQPAVCALHVAQHLQPQLLLLLHYQQHSLAGRCSSQACALCCSCVPWCWRQGAVE